MRNRGPDPKEIVGLSILAVALIILATALVCAGLLALYFAKLREDVLLGDSSDPLYPLWISTGVTAMIFAGSAVGALLQTSEMGNIAVIELYKLAMNGRAPRTNWLGKLSIDWGQHYFTPLALNFAFPFWVELCAALYLTRWGVRKWSRNQAKKRWEDFRNPRNSALYVKAAATGYLAVCIMLGNLIAGHVKYVKLGCDVNGPICRYAQSTEWVLPGFVVAKLATAIDAWLVLPYTITLSIGNQFKLAELYPGLLAGLFIYRWLGAGGSLSDLNLPTLTMPRIPSQAMAKRVPMPSRFAVEIAALATICTIVGAGSFFVTLWLLEW